MLNREAIGRSKTNNKTKKFMSRSYFEVLREDVLEVNHDGDHIPLEEFAEELLTGFCQNQIQGFHAFSNVLVATPGLEQHIKVASTAMTA